MSAHFKGSMMRPKSEISETAVWPIFFLINIITDFKGTYFQFLFLLFTILVWLGFHKSLSAIGRRHSGDIIAKPDT